MKCPKCGYLGFEAVDRCRNCGYEFTLTSSSTLPDLSLRPNTGDRLQPLEDLALVDAASSQPVGSTVASSARAERGNAQTALSDLPLFGLPVVDDTPLITKASPPRPPLAVRRATPEVPRLRSETRSASFEPPLPGLEPAVVAPALGRTSTRGGAAEAHPALLTARAERAGTTARLVAAVLDLVLLALIDGLVVYLTMQICGLTWNEVAILPKAPLMAFLIVQNLGYFVAFTAGGQTLGKMAAGIKVVVGDSDTSPDLPQAVRRTLLWVALALPAGLGFLTTLANSDRRGLHDRLADTRVVRATV